MKGSDLYFYLHSYLCIQVDESHYYVMDDHIRHTQGDRSQNLLTADLVSVGFFRL